MVLALFAGLAESARAATVTVKSTADVAVGGDGLCTLREAIATTNINEALAGAGAGDCAAGQDGPAIRDAIAFEIAGAGVHTLNPATTLGSITDQVEIDGRNGTGNLIRIEIDGGAVPPTASDTEDGFFLLSNISNGSYLHHLAIFDFPDDGIELQGGGNELGRLIVGMDQGGLVADGNGGDGIAIRGDGNEIADSTVSGNGGNGIGVDPLPPGSGAGTTIHGSLIGTSKDGTAAVPNAGDGIRASLNTLNGAADDLTIGGSADTPGACDGDCNLISGNAGDGIDVNILGGGSLRTDGLEVRGNRIGTDLAGTAAIPNASSIGAGVKITGATVGAAIVANLVSGNAGNGVMLQAGNGGVGTAAPTSTVIAANTIGLAAGGALPLANGKFGISLDRSLPAGPSMAGTVIGGPADPTPGGICDGDCNLISANAQSGISIFSTSGGQIASTEILGNYIGTDVTGTLDRGNSVWGAVLAGATGTVLGRPGSPNVISANGASGIAMYEGTTTGNTIQANLIGVAVNGAALGNDDHGIETGAGAGGPSGNLIGGTTAGQGNAIAHNGSSGVALTGGVGPALDNAVLGNAIFANGGLGIDFRLTLLEVGVTENGACPEPEGANRCQQFPLLSAAAGGGAAAAGTLVSDPGKRFRIELFANLAKDPSGNGEGERFLGAVEATTDAAGNASWLFADPGRTIGDGEWVTATATELAGNGAPLSTSEFSDALAAPTCNLPGDGGANVLAGGSGDEVICGLGGPDSLSGGGGRDALLGGEGDDAIDARDGAADAMVDCGPGTDRVSADAEAVDSAAIFRDCETVERPGGSPPPGDGGGGAPPSPPGPVVRCGGKVATIVGSAAAESLRGTARADVIAALGGNDRIKAKGGNDLVCAGKGDDRVDGGEGKDLLFGEGGADRLAGGPGKGDVCNGQAGKDTLAGRGAGCETRKSVG